MQKKLLKKVEAPLKADPCVIRLHLLVSCCEVHTGLIASKSFQNYIFKGFNILKTLTLWLSVLTKTLFNSHTYKIDKGEKIHRGTFKY